MNQDHQSSQRKKLEDNQLKEWDNQPFSSFSPIRSEDSFPYHMDEQFFSSFYQLSGKVLHSEEKDIIEIGRLNFKNDDQENTKGNMILDNEFREFGNQSTWSLLDIRNEFLHFQTYENDNSFIPPQNRKSFDLEENENYQNRTLNYRIHDLPTRDNTKNNDLTKENQLTAGESQDSAISKTNQPNEANPDKNTCSKEPTKILIEKLGIDYSPKEADYFTEHPEKPSDLTVIETTKSINSFNEKNIKPINITKNDFMPKQKNSVFEIKKIPQEEMETELYNKLKGESLSNFYQELDVYLIKKNIFDEKISRKFKSNKKSNGKRKLNNDSINKKLKTNCLNFLSKLFKFEKFGFPQNEKINHSVCRNKEFNKMSIKTIIQHALEEKKINSHTHFEKIKENVQIFEYLGFSFAEFFDKVYFYSDYFKTFLSKNIDDPYYLKTLIKKAYGYVRYFEDEKCIKSPKKSRKTIEMKEY